MTLPKQQQAAMDFLLSLQPGERASAERVAEAIGSTKRGTGGVLARLMEKRLVVPRAGLCDYEWEARR